MAETGKIPHERPRSEALPRDESPPEDPRRALGRLGEDLAVAHLRRLGFTLLERNARTRYGEIDAIAFEGRTLIFVEVKTRRLSGSPRKARRPRRTAPGGPALAPAQSPAPPGNGMVV